MDRKFRVPRVWSNKELEKFAKLFVGGGGAMYQVG